MSSAKEAASKLSSLAKEKSVRFPKVWDDLKILQTCGATILLFRDGDSFDFNAALEKLISTYGVEESKKAAKSPKKKAATAAASPSKRKAGVEEADGEAEAKESDDSPKAKKPKKTETVAEERNRPVAEAIKEIADLSFKNGDPRKGGVFSKAAKAVRECETYISTAKEALALKGVGKGIAGYIEEFLNTGMINKLEEMRAGTA